MLKQSILLFIAFSSFSFGQESVGSLSFGPKKEAQGKIVDKVITIVGNDVITLNELKAANQKQPKLSPDQVLENIITHKLLLQEAKQYNINVSKIPLSLMVQEISVVKNIPQEDLKKLPREQIQEELTLIRLQKAVVKEEVEVNDQEVRDLLEQQLKSKDVQVKLKDLIIIPSNIAGPQHSIDFQRQVAIVNSQIGKVSDQSLANQYTNIKINHLGWVNLADLPARFSSVLFDLPINQYSAPISDSDGVHFLSIEEKKEPEQTKRLSSTQTHVSHILVKPSTSASQKINTIYNKLAEGASFEQLAKEYSEDELSGLKGGELGWVSRGQLVPEFTAVMNNTGKGQISRPFQSSFGFHILKVNDRKEKHFSDKDAIERFVRGKIFQRKAKTEWQLWLQKLRQEAYVKKIGF